MGSDEVETLALARRFIGAVEAGDATAARACFHPDATVWHNYDDDSQTVDQNMALLEWMKKVAPTRRYEITRLEAIAGGYLQQHALHVTSREGQERTLHACAVVRVRDGLIARIEEYLDPSSLADFR